MRKDFVREMGPCLTRIIMKRSLRHYMRRKPIEESKIRINIPGGWLPDERKS